MCVCLCVCVCLNQEKKNYPGMMSCIKKFRGLYFANNFCCLSVSYPVLFVVYKMEILTQAIL